MPGFNLHPIFGFLFALAGLVLAVVLGLVLYKDEKQEPASKENYEEIQEERKAA